MESQRLTTQSDSDLEGMDSGYAMNPSRKGGMKKKVVGVAWAGALFCAGAWVGDHFSFAGPAKGDQHDTQQFTQIIAKPKRQDCSSTRENCYATGCCDVAGYTCFATSPGRAECLKNCTPSQYKSCTQPQSIMDPILQDATPRGTKLYCFAVYTQNTGSTKPSHELEILQYAYSKTISIFACDQTDVFSDVAVEVGPGFHTIVVRDVDNDWHFAKRKTTGSWVNTGMFTQVWKAIARGSKYESANWVAKVDADAVFVPGRLRRWLAKQLVPDDGIYLENCRFVDYGYFGNLEVYSEAAFRTLLENIDMCKASLNWKTGIKNGKYGPMGEDLFAQTCLDKVGVRRIEAFDITTDGACPADRPYDQKENKKWKPNCADVSTPAMHPFKKTHEWVDCHWATISKFGK